MDRGDLIGAVLDGRYRVLEEVAAGAMGVVYRAERVKLGRIVAVKVLHDALPEELAARQRFEVEAIAMAKLAHPHCAAVLDVGLHEGVPFVVMDFVSGENLKDVLERGPLPPARAAEIVRQVLSGLAHAHELGIIHRDIKPANIVLGQRAGLGDHVTILDFGLARFQDASSKLTTGIVVGTPAYMAPEQIRGAPLDARVDVYACGVLLFELLAGVKPFHSETDDPVEVCKMHLSDPIPRLADKRPGEYGALDAVLARALAKDRAERYASAVEFSGALAAVAEPAPRADEEIPASLRTEAVAPLPPPRRATPRRRTIALIGGGIIAASVIIGVIAHGRSSPSEAAVAAPPRAGSGSAAAADPKAAPPAPLVLATSRAPGPAGAAIARAQKLLAAGDRAAAREALDRARRRYPDDADASYALGLVEFDRGAFASGLAAFRAALNLDPTYRTEAGLLRAAARGYAVETGAADDELARFLRDDIGGIAAPFLAEASLSAPTPAARARAAAELRRY